MPRFLVVITDFVTGSLAAEEEILGDLADVVAANGFSEADLADYLPTAAALMVYHNLSITRASIEKLAQCKVIVRCGVGIDNVDFTVSAINGTAVPEPSSLMLLVSGLSALAARRRRA